MLAVELRRPPWRGLLRHCIAVARRYHVHDVRPYARSHARAVHLVRLSALPARPLAYVPRLALAMLVCPAWVASFERLLGNSCTRSFVQPSATSDKVFGCR